MRKRGNFYTFEQMNEKYQIMPSDFIKYLALIKNIPTTYKGMLINESKTNRTQKQSLTEKLKQSKQTNKLLYWTQMKNTVQTSISRGKMGK